jgi:glycosyltransferase involved in cell wall biosynthesis
VTQHPMQGSSHPHGIARVLPYRGTMGYFFNARALRRLVRAVKPDLVNSHYASGYGLTGALVRYRPTLLSVWGSDVFDFPYESWIKGQLLRWNLRRADAIASTSEVMARQVIRLVPGLPREITVTPFGVDTQRFAPMARHSSHDAITIGTVKSLAEKYGIDTLIRAFALLRADGELQTSGHSRKLRLLLVGDGPSRTALERLTNELGVADATRFVGSVAHDAVPEWLNRLDVYVAASRIDSESFGVAVIEASACGVPVVVSDAGGLPEVVDEGRSGFIIERDRPDLLADRLKRLVLDPALRRELGDGGRRLVLERYDWNDCVDRMLECYERVIATHRAGR